MSEFWLKTYRMLPWFRGKLRLGKRLFNKKIELPHPVTIKTHGNLIYHLPNTIENLGIELMINGIYEQDVVNFLKQQVPENAIYFDIGANIGSLGLPVVTTKKNIRYFGFEASPMVFPFLQKNFASNDINDATFINKLVHKDSNQTMKFYQSKWYGKSSLAPTYSPEFVMVASLSIDEYCAENNIDHIDWMKVDVQGFELFVFEGMKEMLEQKKIKNILFEFERWAEETAGFKAGTAMEYIKSSGYELFTIEGVPWASDKKNKDTMIWAKPGG